MRISINLATRPFVELRPLFAKLRLTMAGLALLAVALGIGLHFLSVRAKAAQAQMDALKAQTAALENERQTNEARMREPQNRAVLDRSRFLNELFTRKSFSWTAVMTDLEKVLPGGVQVTSIEPVPTTEGNVNIRLRVNGERERAVDLVRNLERSQRFLSPRLANETAQSQEQGRLVQTSQATVPGGVEFDILSGYNPLPMGMKSAALKEKAVTATRKAGAHAAVMPHVAAPSGRVNKAVPKSARNAGAAGKTGNAGVPGVVP